MSSRPEVDVERAARVAGAIADGIEARHVEALLREELEGGVDERGARLLLGVVTGLDLTRVLRPRFRDLLALLDLAGHLFDIRRRMWKINVTYAFVCDASRSPHADRRRPVFFPRIHVRRRAPGDVAPAAGERLRKLDALLDLTCPELEALYVGARVPRMGQVAGDLRGRMLAWPSLESRPGVAGAIRSFAGSKGFPWRGKTSLAAKPDRRRRDQSRRSAIASACSASRPSSRRRAPATSTRSSSTTTSAATRPSSAASRTRSASSSPGSGSARRGCKTSKADPLALLRARERMKALVTGAAGFIGSNVVRASLDDGHEVRALHLPGEDLPEPARPRRRARRRRRDRPSVDARAHAGLRGRLSPRRGLRALDADPTSCIA